MGTEHAVIVDNDSAALLPAMLQGIKPVVTGMCHVRRLGSNDAEYAAFFMNRHYASPPFPAAAPTNPKNNGCGLFGRLLNSG